MVHTPKGPVASGLGEAEVTLEEAVVEVGEVTPCRMPALTMLMIPSWVAAWHQGTGVNGELAHVSEGLASGC